MKKTLLALAIPALMAASANAAVMYNDNGVTVSIQGDLDVQYIKTQDKKNSDGTDNTAQLAVDDADFGFGLKYDVTEDLAVGGALSIDGDNDDNDSSLDLEEAYVGLIFGGSTLTFGEQYTILDDSGIGDDYEFGLKGAASNADFYGDQVIKYVYDNGEMFYGAVAYSAHKNSGPVTEGDYELDGRVGARVEDFDFTVYFGKSEMSKLETTMIDFEARYTMGDFGIAATYVMSTYDLDNVTKDLDSSLFGLAGTYAMNDKVSFAAGIATTDTGVSGEDDVFSGYVNTTYTFTENVWSYAEVGFTDEDQKETGYVVGMGVSF